MEKEKVLRIVDACFSEFASSYRSDAKKKANELYDLLNTEVVKENDLSHIVSVPFCPECGSDDTYETKLKGNYTCYECGWIWAI